jgi:ketosteroid isomerase-like protein
MSQENVELVRQAYDSWIREGVEGMIPFLDAEIEWRNPEEGVGGNFYGHEGVRAWAGQVDKAFEEVRFEVDRIEDLSDARVLVVLHAHVKGRGSGVEMKVPLAHVVEVRAGKAIGLTEYTSVHAALEAVGLEQ